MNKSQKILLWAAGITVLVIVILFSYAVAVMVVNAANPHSIGKYIKDVKESSK